MAATADIEQLIQFVNFTHKIREVERAVLLGSLTRHENDAEHCYQLALVAWFLLETHQLNLDKTKVIGLAMVHDVVEAYAGDMTAFASPEQRALHAEREKQAAQTLQADWPTFTSLHELIAEYETRETDEALFVYALDKLLPIINNYLNDGLAWKQQGVTFERMKAVKTGKIDKSDLVNEYYVLLLDLLEKKPDLFGTTKAHEQKD